MAAPPARRASAPAKRQHSAGASTGGQSQQQVERAQYDGDSADQGTDDLVHYPSRLSLNRSPAASDIPGMTCW
jgi:hypothetical protein